MKSHPVLELMARRIKERSEPGHRRDGFRLALVVEGGAMRGVVSSGMLWALEEAGFLPCFDLAVGCSAGALNVSSFLAGVAGACTREYAGAFRSGRFIRPARALVGRPVIDLDYSLDFESTILDGRRYDRVLESPIPLHCVATDVDQARRALLSDFRSRDEIRTALKATSSLPLVAGGPVEFRGRHYLDGGITEAIPVASARELGATHALVLQTRPRGLRYPPPKGLFRHLVELRLGRLHPVLPTLYHRRNHVYDETCDLLDQEQAKGDAALPSVFCLRLPEGSPSVSHLERRPEVLRDRAAAGREVARAELAVPVAALTGK
ncbi:MAG TPA: patatin family protein [Fibrobacteria bacterium]|nr:patatin family protein [Fibrobacteria bacterium]HOX51425.1 patatin family protein [Fibrobacteria bacterium]